MNMQQPLHPLRWSTTSSLLTHRILLLFLPVLLLAVSGCIPITAEEATPQPTQAPQAIPVVALAPPSARPGTTVFLSSAGWQPNDVVTLNIVSLQAGETMTTTIFTDAADEQGRFNASFLLPADLDQSDDPEVTVVVTSNTSGASASAPFLLAIATAMPTAPVTNTVVATNTPLATSTATTTAVATQTAAPTASPAQTATPRPTNFAVVVSAGLNLRTGPAVTYPVIRALAAGTGVTVLGRNSNGDWLYVRLSNGAEGWLATRFTDFNGAVPIVGTPALPPTPTLTPVTTATPVITEWRGEYYDNDALLYPPVFIRNDSGIDFNWGQGSPGAGIPNDEFSARWTRSVAFAEGTYRFNATSDDGVRIWLDGDLIIDQWRDTSVVTYSAERYVSGGNHALRVEYYENNQTATMRFWWERVDTTPSYPDWKGEYWSNRHFDGSPTLTRNDDEIDFNWGSGAPDERLPRDNFAVRWTQRVEFDEGLYRFYARADDGIRIYLDNELILDEWHDSLANAEYTVDQRLDDDDYRIRVEYYERSGGARVEFSWDRIRETATATPLPTQTATATTVAPTATATPLPTQTATATTLPPTATSTTVPPTATATMTATATAVPVAIINPTAGEAGTQVTITGNGFPANTTVNVHLGALAAAAAAAAQPTVYATTTTDATGAYQVAFTIPDQWPDGSPLTDGRLVVIVATANFGAQASASFAYRTAAVTSTVTPTVTPTATATTATTATETPAVTDTPTVAPSPTVAVSPTPAANVRLAPTTGAANTQVTVSGSGFPANSSVYIYLGAFDGAIDPNNAPEHYVILPTNANGEYSGVLAIPSTWPTGEALAPGPVIVLVATNDFSVQASATFTYTGPTP